MKPLRSKAVEQTTLSSPLWILAVADGETASKSHDRSHLPYNHALIMSFISARPILRLPVFGWETFSGNQASPTPCLAFTTSGRASIYRTLKILRITAGKSVLVPTYHCPTMVAPIIALGGDPIFCPIDATTELVRPDTRAIIAPHYLGLPQLMKQLRGWCDTQDIANTHALCIKPMNLRQRLKTAVVTHFLSYDSDHLKHLLSLVSLQRGDTLMLHSSWRPLKDFKGAPAQFNVVLREYLGMGLLAEVFRRNKETVRSLSPTHPLLAWGKDAPDFIADHEKTDRPFGPQSPFAKLLKRNALLLCLDVGFSSITFTHFRRRSALDSALVPLLTRQTDAAAALDGPMGGALLEGWVVAEAAKASMALSCKPDLYYWRSHDALEVGLLPVIDGKLWPVEIRLTAKTAAGHVEPRNRCTAGPGDQATGQGVLGCRTARPQPLPHGPTVCTHPPHHSGASRNPENGNRKTSICPVFLGILVRQAIPMSIAADVLDPGFRRGDRGVEMCAYGRPHGHLALPWHAFPAWLQSHLANKR